MHQIEGMAFLKSGILGVLMSLFFCISVDAQHKVDASHLFIVQGEVEKPVVFDIATIRKYTSVPLGDVVIKNHRGQDKKTANNVKGVLLKTLLDSVHVKVDKPKYYSELIVVLEATDGYKNVYSWNELINTDVGNHVYVITDKDGQGIESMDEAIVVISMSDINVGSRYLRGFAKLEIKRVQ